MSDLTRHPDPNGPDPTSPEPAVRAVVALGSSLGPREATLLAAVHDVDAVEGCSVLAVSSLYETDALTPSGIDLTAPSYLNGALIVATTLPPHALLAELLAIESAHGRVREGVWAPRTLDLDLIVYGDTTMDDRVLTIPHPLAHLRSFVLVPWSEIDPDAVLPGRGSIRELLASIDETPRLYATEWVG